jgi:hypothetical protein
MNRVARVFASNRRTWTGLLAAAMLMATAGTGFAQEPPPPPPPPPPPQQAPAPPPEAPDQLLFKTSSPLILINQINQAKTADFESAWADIRAAFAKVTDPELQAFAQTLSNLYKVDLPPAPTQQGGQAVVYIFEIETPSTTISYNPVKILFETLHKKAEVLTYEEAMAIHKKFDGAYASINPWPLVKIGSGSLQ